MADAVGPGRVVAAALVFFATVEVLAGVLVRVFVAAMVVVAVATARLRVVIVFAGGC